MHPGAGDSFNQEMVDSLIAQGALWSPRLIAAFRATPRHLFLDRVYQYVRRQAGWRELNTRHPGPAELRVVYSDRALITRLGRPEAGGLEVPISSSSQPSLMAQMLEDLRLQAGQRVLEVGAGTGYNAALLAHAVEPGEVLSLDVDREVLAGAREHLALFADRQVRLGHTDGRHGFPEAAPFDRIMVTASTPDLEPAWLEQLTSDGLLLAPLSLAPGLSFIVRGQVVDGVFEGGLTRAAYFMSLRTEGEPGGAEEPPQPSHGRYERVPAPWADWQDRRRRISWYGFVRSLAFFGWLRGLTIGYQATSEDRATFLVQSERGDAACWLGEQDWHVTGAAGQVLGRELWEAFLDAGGPWPTEYRLRAAPHGQALKAPPGSHVHNGERCRQVWQLFEPRDRLAPA